MSSKESLTPYEQYLTHLHIAHMHAQIALDMLYEENDIKRPFWYRTRLGNTQCRLITLINREYKRYSKRYSLKEG